MAGTSILTVSWPQAIPGSSQAEDMVDFRLFQAWPLKVWSVDQRVVSLDTVSRVPSGLMLC